MAVFEKEFRNCSSHDIGNDDDFKIMQFFTLKNCQEHDGKFDKPKSTSGTRWKIWHIELHIRKMMENLTH
jgi:hypothetical protein